MVKYLVVLLIVALLLIIFSVKNHSKSLMWVGIAILVLVVVFMIWMMFVLIPSM